MWYRIALLLLLLTGNFQGPLRAQDTKPLPVGPYLNSAEIGRQSMIMQFREFQDSALFDYWGDCPELLMEYGFKRLIFEDVFVYRNLYHIELAEMKDSVAAFGAYSVASGSGGQRDSFYEYSFLTEREALFVKGSWYVRIHCIKPDTLTDREMLVPLATMILAKIEGMPYVPPGILTAGSLRQFRSALKLIKGYLGLYYGFPSWVDLFRNIQYDEIAILAVVQPEGHLNFARISFSNGVELEKFQKKNGLYDPSNPGYMKQKQRKTSWVFLRTSENTALLLQSEGKDPYLDSVREQIEMIGNKK